MAFTQQNNDGTVDGANAYTDPATVRAYWSDRGVDLTARTDPELQVAIVNSTTYLDGRYRWVGYQLRRLQVVDAQGPQQLALPGSVERKHQVVPATAQQIADLAQLHPAVLEAGRGRQGAEADHGRVEVRRHGEHPGQVAATSVVDVVADHAAPRSGSIVS